LDQIQEFALSALVEFGVQYFGDFVFKVIINFYQRRRRLNPVRNFIRSCGFKLGNVENWMYGMEVIWESESERRWSNFSNDFEWTEILLR